MPELSWPLLLAALALFVVIALVFMKSIPRAVGKQCPNCLRRVPKGETACPGCGKPVTAGNDLGK